MAKPDIKALWLAVQLFFEQLISFGLEECALSLTLIDFYRCYNSDKSETPKPLHIFAELIGTNGFYVLINTHS